jgi:hypothetical protein
MKKKLIQLRKSVVKPFLLLCHYVFLIPLRPISQKKLSLLSRWFEFNTSHVEQPSVEKLLFRVVFKNWVENEYLKELNPDKREELKSIAMGGVNSANWAAIYDSRALNLSAKAFDPNTQEALPILAYVEAACEKDKPDRVIQIGCSSGREIAYFAKLYPDIGCIGTDIYTEVIEYCKTNHVSENLSFESCSAHRIHELINCFQNQKTLIVSSGSLQYVQPEHMSEFFSQLTNLYNQSVTVFVGEPASELTGDPDGLCGSVWRGNFSYTHDYRYYSEKAGLRTLKSEMIRPGTNYYKKFPRARGTVHYLFIASTDT